MEDEWTCGKGLAAHAPLPAAMAEATAAVAEVLELHTAALDRGEDAGRREHEAYRRLAEHHRSIARSLRALAGELESYQELPAAAHDERALSEPRHRDAFARFVASEEALRNLLRERLEEDRRMLAEMEGTA
jgi:hypothetical protein